MKQEAGSRNDSPSSLVLLLSCLLLLASCFLFSACAVSYDTRGRYHRVQSGETIQKIAGVYRVPVQELAELNNIQDASALKEGQRLYIPERHRKRLYKRLPKGERQKYDAPIQVDRTRFAWPVDGRVISGFGIRDGHRHDGIDISASSGTPIKAAADGRVVFSSRLGGYGNTIIIKHDGNFFTAYAHSQQNLVKKGVKVKKGHVIAKAGRTGRATGPHLHFEVRHRQKARNPLFFLPVK